MALGPKHAPVDTRGLEKVSTATGPPGEHAMASRKRVDGQEGSFVNGCMVLEWCREMRSRGEQRRSVTVTPDQ